MGEDGHWMKQVAVMEPIAREERGWAGDGGEMVVLGKQDDDDEGESEVGEQSKERGVWVQREGGRESERGRPTGGGC